MKIRSLEEMHRGWIIGDFEPSILKTGCFEVGLLSHKKNEKWPAHVHKIAKEYNVLVSGKMKINGLVIEENTIFVIDEGEIATPEFLEDCVVLCVKVPSIPGDKYEIL